MRTATVALRSQLPEARILARSFGCHHPGQTVEVLVADDPDHGVEQHGEPFVLLRPEDVGVDRVELHRMALLFGPRLSVALKPWLLEHLLRSGPGPVVYLDPQVMVYDSLDPLTELADGGSMVLVPQVLDPMPQDGLDPDETAILGRGIFSAGALVLGPDTEEFTDFLKVRLRRECLVDIPHMRMLDQRWLDFVPSLFPYRVARDRGVDVGYWNLHERPLTVRDGRTLVGESPLRTFNFSEYDIARPGSLGASELRGSPRVVAGNHPVVMDLCEQYGAEIRAAGADAAVSEGFGFRTLPGGFTIENSLRRIYSDALEVVEATGRPAPPDPFDPAEASDFISWARSAYLQQGLAVPETLERGPVQQPTPLISRSMRSRISRLVRSRVPRA